MEGDRGLIKYKELYHKEFNWTNFRYNNITPTDLDFFIEYQDKLFILGEVKYNYSNMPYGQELAFERLIDDITKPSLFIFGTYTDNDYDNEERIILNKCKVIKYRYKKEWHETKYYFKELCDLFIKKFG